MNIGLKQGAIGQAVERLHRILAGGGFAIDEGERARQEFGPSTAEAMRELQRRHGCEPHGEIDETTFNILLALEEKITINVYEGNQPPPQPKPDEHKGKVTGTLVDGDGAALANTQVALFALQVRSETRLGQATTDKDGQYKIEYKREAALNLVMRAYDAQNNMIAQSMTYFAAPAQVQINFTTAADGVVRPPSLFTKLTQAAATQLGGIALTSLTENSTTHELQFLASAIGAPFDDVAYLYIAETLAAQNKMQPQTFFGIFYEGIPASLDAALNNLPSSGIDSTFAAQALSGVLAHDDGSLSAVLTDATNANILPASYAAAQASELTLLDGLRIASAGNSAYVRGKTSLNDLLGAGGVTTAVQTAFIQAYAANQGQLGPTWKTLRANTSLPAADLTTLNTALSLGELFAGNLPLIKDTLTRLTNNPLSSIPNLALLDESDWVARITAVDPNASSIPPVLPDETPQQRITRLAKALTERFGSRYPTTAFAGGLSRATTTSFANTKEELVNFLSNNSKFSFKTSNIDQFISTNKLTLTSDGLADLKTAQRLFRVSPHFTTIDAMHAAGLKSAQSVYFQGRDNFIANMTTAFGSAPLAKMAYARAQMTYSASLMLYSQLNSAFNGLHFPVFQNPQPEPSAITNLPDLQVLFGGPLDYFQCDDCQSVYSPAAYLVDLLQYLSMIPASGGGVTNARDALLLQRPDIQYIALDCNNTNTTLPYIDLVNELLEAAISPPNPPVTVIDTSGTSAERRALPQQISQAAYALTASTVFPLNLPFDLAFAQTSAYIAALGTTRAAVLSLFAGNPVPAATATAIAAASLGINPEMLKVIDGTDGNQQWQRWGLAQNPTQVIDPETRQPYSPTPATWVDALAKVPFLMNESGLSLQQLYQLLEVLWVTQDGVTLSLGTMTEGTLQMLSPDADAMVFTGLTGDVLDRANRFLRLWTASGLQMWELDWALEEASGGVLNDAFVVFLAGAIAVKNQLNLPLQEALSFWMPLETRDVTNHLGDEDTVTPSTYSEVFRNPAVLASAGDIFVPLTQNIVTGATDASPIAITTAEPHGYQTGQMVTISGVAGNTAANGTFTITVTGATTFTLNGTTGSGNWTSGGTVVGTLSGNLILSTSPAPPTAEQNAITAALGLSADDIAAILNFSGAAPNLTLATLNTLLQYQRLAKSLSLTVEVLVLWIQLTGQAPFNGTPANTLEFCRRLSVLQATGLAVYDVDYLIRDQSASQSSLAFTTADATAVLQAIASAIAKLPTPVVIPVAGASNAAPIVITTATANGLLTGTQVTIGGVGGNTAANGTFTITVNSSTSFSLNGSSGNGAWTSGGTITVNAYTPEAIENIFVAALVAATSTSADVVTPILESTGVLPLDATTIGVLAAQTSNVNPSQFPALVNAFTAVDKAAALFTALNPSNSAFTFAVENASTFGWLNPASLPLTPVSTSPYAQFEALLRAFRLQQLQPARAPKLFDIFTQWLPPNTPPPDLQTAIAGPLITVAGASNTSPITITTAAPNSLETGEQVTITGVQGNTAANGTFTITVVNSTTFTLNGSQGTGAWTSGGTVSQPSLAFALNASVSDVTAIATQLGATPPGLTPATLPGSLADVAMLTAIANALAVTRQYGISGTTLVQLAAIPATAASATAAMGALQSQYAQSAWFGAIQPVEDTLRQNRRDALVAYMLGPGPATPVPMLLNTDDIYNYYLIDPEMCPCALMTRLLQASLAIQQFVQQCFLNLFFSDVTVNMTSSLWNEWTWRQQYRLWQANREVFLYPENYLLPQLRKDASPFFNDLTNDVSQSNCDEDLVEAAIQNYLRKLVGVSHLHVACHYNQLQADGTYVLWVFARTHAHPPQWYYRTRTGTSPYSGSWSAWQQLSLDISSQHLVPVIWDQRLFLVWPVFKQISQQQSSQSVPGSGGGSQAPASKFTVLEFCYSEFSAGQWQAKQTLEEKAYFDTADSPLAFSFRAQQDASYNLQLQVYFYAIEEAIAGAMEDAEIEAAAIEGLISGLGAIGGSVTISGSSQFQDSDLGSIATVQLSFNGTSPVISLLSSTGTSTLVGKGMLPMPESPLQVVELSQILPPAQDIDMSQDPTYALIITQSMSGQLATPANYGFAGQDLVWGNYTLPPPGSVPLNVLCASTHSGQPNSITLLKTITNPRVVIPVQEPVFDCADPFFVSEPQRVYLVQPTYWTLGSRGTEVTNITYMKQWATEFEFETFYHPYARTFLRELEIGGVPQLLSRGLQLNPQGTRGWTPTFNFQTLYNPTSYVSRPYPGSTSAAPWANPAFAGDDPGETYLDFAPADSGAYSLYNWEIFYHIPMYISSQLLQNQQFQDALTWLEYIFNPTDTSGGAVPQHYWEFAPLNAMNSNTWWTQEVTNLLATLAAGYATNQPGINDSSTAVAIASWMQDPYDPFEVANTRWSAYGKATIMAFLNTLIAWGDWYYAQYTAEMVSQAEQLYILADMILGPAPQETRMPDSDQSGASTITYASLKNDNIDPFSNAIVTVENIVVAPEPPQSVINGSMQTPMLPHFPGGGSNNTLLFCIPPNGQMLAYWSTVAQRLYNIRHCLNLQGQPQPLPLYAPPINPLALIEAEQAGAGLSSATPAAPVYRFSVYLERAMDLTNDVRAYGALILSALEKQDAETLAAMRANQELNIQTAMLGVKQSQVQEAQDQITALQNQQAVVQVRYNYYSTIQYMNAWETAALALQAGALAMNGLGIVLDLTAGELHMIPSFSIGIAGFGGTPNLSMSIGGENFAGVVSAFAQVIQLQASMLGQQASMQSTLGGYQRRWNDWQFQAQLANAELTQVASQITAAQDRLNTAQQELAIQNTTIQNAQAVATFLTSKFTNAQLYSWMLSQLTTVYTQAYQLAYSLALQAQNAFQYELGSSDTFIQFGYWDSQHKGLTAGESLLFDLRRMQAQYLAENTRELELTKHISLVLDAPEALVTLRETGTCQIALDEILFEEDHPGLYFRRLRSVALTVPCVTGMYTGVNATLTLTNAMVRTQAAGTSYQPQSATAGPNDPTVLVSPIAAAGTQTIVTSSGQNDSGLFNANLSDDRWLPFEGQGAISTWNLVLDPRDNNFDITTITDVVLHVRYTARGGGNQTAADNVRSALKAQLSTTTRSIMLSVKNTFPDSYYTFFNPGSGATAETLSLPLTANVFPYTNLGHGTAEIKNVDFWVVLAVPAAGNNMQVNFSASANPVTLAPAPGQTTAGNALEALMASVAISPALAAPQTMTLTLPLANIPASLGVKVSGQTQLDPSKVLDILLVVSYSIS